MKNTIALLFLVATVGACGGLDDGNGHDDGMHFMPDHEIAFRAPLRTTAPAPAVKTPEGEESPALETGKESVRAPLAAGELLHVTLVGNAACHRALDGRIFCAATELRLPPLQKAN